MVAAAGLASADVIYDASTGKTPENGWGWSFAGLGSYAETAPTSPNYLAQLDTSVSNSTQAGWSRLAPSPLDSTVGYVATFTLKVDAEDHSSASADKNGDGLADRAGVSLILLGNDKKGVELGFWQDSVWTQQDSPLFVNSSTESAAFNTTALTTYTLSVSQGKYTLAANGTDLLSGSLKDYTAFSGVINPYSTPNYVFLGDDTTSAKGAFSLGKFEINPVPEPGTLAFLAAPLGLVLLRRRR